MVVSFRGDDRWHHGAFLAWWLPARRICGETEDQYGNDWHGRINEDGSQTWTESRNGRIFDGGVNKKPIPFDPKTGLKSPGRPW